MGGGDANPDDDRRRVEGVRREFNRLHIQPEEMTEQFNPFFMEPQAMPQSFSFNPLVFQLPQKTLFVRRVYVGCLPPSANEQTIAAFFNQAMAAIGGNTAGKGDAVCNVSVNHELRFALVEFRATEEASNAMALDGILFEGSPLKVRRPADYNPSLAAALGPSQPGPELNLAAVGLTVGSARRFEDPYSIFVGGLPYDFTDAQVRKLLESFGPLRGFELVKDRETGNSKGYAFCVYEDTTVTEIACAALNGAKMGDKTLTVRLANQGSQLRPGENCVRVGPYCIGTQTETVRRGNHKASQQIRRPADYNHKLNLAAVGLTAGSAGWVEDPDRIFVGGLPYDFTEAQVRQLLESFGPLKGIELMKDRETGNSKGYAFCVYMDRTITEIACAALNGIMMGDKTLTVRRANQGASQPRPEHESILLPAQQQKLSYEVVALPTKVVCLSQVVTADQLKDDEEYEDIMEDMRLEAGKYGSLVKVVIPRPDPSGHPVAGVGKVFLEFADVYCATRGKTALHGRKFDGKPVVATYYPELKFANLDLDR